MQQQQQLSSGGITTAPKTKLLLITRHPPIEIATNSLAHFPTDQPIHPPCATAVRAAVSTAVADALIHAEFVRYRAGISYFPLIPPRSRGESEPSPGGAPLHAPRTPSLSSAPVSSPGSPRADAWSGRGAVAVPRGVRWCTIEPRTSGE